MEVNKAEGGELESTRKLRVNRRTHGRIEGSQFMGAYEHDLMAWNPLWVVILSEVRSQVR